MGTEYINIAPRDIAGKCNQKCAYDFKYEASNSTASNNGLFVSLTYDNTKTQSVIYGSKQYNVTSIMLFAPSLHNYLGNTTNAELVVKHDQIDGGPSSLYVCVPIVQSSDNSLAGSMLSTAIQNIAKYAPGNSETTTLNSSSFSLQTLIPNAPFFNYVNTGKDFPGDYIVFGRMSAIPLPQKIIELLTSIIKPYPTTMTGEKIYINEIGPNHKKADEGIYIDCNPTGSSEEETDIVNDKQDQSFTLTPEMMYVLLAILIIALSPMFFKLLKLAYDKLFSTVSISNK
jgi:hypothetical protein